MGKARFPEARRLLITADAGGSNSYGNRLFKVELARLAKEAGLEITVCRYPPGTSKWNKIEHKMFSFITMNWRGRPLVSNRTIIELISATTTNRLGPLLASGTNFSGEGSLAYRDRPSSSLGEPTGHIAWQKSAAESRAEVVRKSCRQHAPAPAQVARRIELAQWRHESRELSRGGP